VRKLLGAWMILAGYARRLLDEFPDFQGQLDLF
jgi:hypothetical protein